MTRIVLGVMLMVTAMVVQAAPGDKTALGKCQDAVDAAYKDCNDRCDPSGGTTTTTMPTLPGGHGTAESPAPGGGDEDIRACYEHCDKENQRMRAACYEDNPPANTPTGDRPKKPGKKPGKKPKDK